MKNRKWIVIMVWVVLIAVTGSVGYFVGQRRAGPVAEGEQVAQKQLWRCPMHPEYISDSPGECPICGMTLVLIEEEQEADMAEASMVAGLSTVHLSDTKRQLVGVTTVAVVRQAMSKKIRTVGIVKPDETNLRTVNAKIGGWIEQLYVDFEGAPIRRGQPMLTIYSPELLQTQEEYLAALQIQEELQHSEFVEVQRTGQQLVAAAERRLRLWDIPEKDIARLRKTGETRRTMTLYAPYTGIVLERMVEVGTEIKPGMPLFKISDLSRLWIEADIYEKDIADVRNGQAVTITFDAYPGKEWTGTIEYTYPYLDGRTRTMKARIALKNPGLSIKPEMYAQIQIDLPLGDVLAIPMQSVIDTGERKVVYVETDTGMYTPQQIKTGKDNGSVVEVLEGLSEGEQIVERGLFMIDSESRLRAKISGASTGHTGH